VDAASGSGNVVVELFVHPMIGMLAFGGAAFACGGGELSLPMLVLTVVIGFGVPFGRALFRLTRGAR
jgi:hypothetical protein